jgi:hypothetical protein
MGFRTVAIAPGREKEKLARELGLFDTLRDEDKRQIAAVKR